ncbi:sigma 54-interacting transcriptional regulator [Escherichia coli]
MESELFCYVKGAFTGASANGKTGSDSRRRIRARCFSMNR